MRMSLSRIALGRSHPRDRAHVLTWEEFSICVLSRVDTLEGESSPNMVRASMTYSHPFTQDVYQRILSFHLDLCELFTAGVYWYR